MSQVQDPGLALALAVTEMRLRLVQIRDVVEHAPISAPLRALLTDLCDVPGAARYIAQDKRHPHGLRM